MQVRVSTSEKYTDICCMPVFDELLFVVSLPAAWRAAQRAGM